MPTNVRHPSKEEIIEEILVSKERVKRKKQQRLIMSQVGLDFLIP